MTPQDKAMLADYLDLMKTVEEQKVLIDQLRRELRTYRMAEIAAAERQMNWEDSCNGIRKRGE